MRTLVGTREQPRRAVAWLDPDRVHVWFEHDCAGGQVVTTMLPHPHWHTEGGDVMPSVDCSACGFHNLLVLDERRTFKARIEHMVEDQRDLLDRIAHGPADAPEDTP